MVCYQDSIIRIVCLYYRSTYLLLLELSFFWVGLDLVVVGKLGTALNTRNDCMKRLGSILSLIVLMAIRLVVLLSIGCYEVRTILKIRRKGW